MIVVSCGQVLLLYYICISATEKCLADLQNINTHVRKCLVCTVHPLLVCKAITSLHMYMVCIAYVVIFNDMFYVHSSNRIIIKHLMMQHITV